VAVLLVGLAMLRLAARDNFLALWALLPLLLFAAGVLVLLAVALLKWVIVGRYRPRVEPLWATFVRRTELITALYENAAVPALIAQLLGTPLMRPALNLLGARVGRRVWLDTTYLTEFDLVSVGDDAVVGGFTSLQTHLFEDRVMKMSRVDISEASTVGSRTIVLYDSRIGERAVLDSLSLAMKGETLPDLTRWRGIPARGAR
jgi:non-ribosomal peptide synthetase-like protein